MLKLSRIQTGANVAGAALLLWLSGPLLRIGDGHPFEGTQARIGLLIGVGLVALLAWATAQWMRRRRNAHLLDQLQVGSPPGVLAERFANAMHLLRSGVATSGASKAHWWQRGRQVYQLPWYVFIGAPGSGKTTALLHSGLRFPLAERLGNAPVAGIGGTRQCDWWFTDQAVFIDTAGRFTTQDSHSATDAQEWQVFMRLLRRYRPQQPINGVIVTVSVPDLLQGGAELEHQAAAVDRRLQELRSQLNLSFPVYLLVTKVDLLSGFVEFFGDFDVAEREQPWGITFQLKSSNEPDALPADLASQLATLPARIAAMSPQRQQTEPQPQRRAAIYLFSAQVEALLPALEDFARHAFKSASQAPRQMIRGIHLSSGTQEGNPIDRVLGELARSYGITLRDPPRVAGRGKAYFIAALLQRLIIAEAPLAGTSLQRQRHRRWLSRGVGLAAATALVIACVAWSVSYRNNLAYVASVRERVDKVTQQIDPAKGSSLDQLLPLYSLLGQLASSGDVDPAKASWSLDFGLFQGPRLAQSAEQTYRKVLDRTLAPLLAERLTQALRQESDPAARYEALRIGLMLVTPSKLQRGEVRRWAAQAFSAGGLAPAAGEQAEWLRHLDALLERNAVLDAVRLDDATVRSARSALASTPMDQRIHDRLLRRAREQLGGGQTLAELASPAAVLAFAPQDAASNMPAIPAMFTRAAWRDVIAPAIEPTISELADEADWVMGARSPATQRLLRDPVARETIARQVGQRHAQATIASWDRFLSTIALQLPEDAPSLESFTVALAAPESPLRQLLRRISTEFPQASGTSASAATQAYEASLAEHFNALREYAFGSGNAAVDKLVAPLPAVLREPAGTRAAELARDLRAEALRAPPPFRNILSALADAAGSQRRRGSEHEPVGSLSELAQTCSRLTADRYPFAAGAKRDMPYADFARLFGPRGMLESYFRSNLSSQVDTKRRPWRLVKETGASEKARTTLRSFEMAEDIRRVFFSSDSALPQLRLQITPVSMDEELLMFSADIDGQLLRYENGPRRTKALVWPGPAATQRVMLRILPAGPSGTSAEVQEGPWALLRALQTRGNASTAQNSRLIVDGRALNVEVSSDAPGGAALLGELSKFSCPEPW